MGLVAKHFAALETYWRRYVALFAPAILASALRAWYFGRYFMAFPERLAISFNYPRWDSVLRTVVRTGLPITALVCYRPRPISVVCRRGMPNANMSAYRTVEGGEEHG